MRKRRTLTPTGFASLATSPFQGEDYLATFFI